MLVGSGNTLMSEDIVAANNNDTEETTETENEAALGTVLATQPLFLLL